MTLSDLRGPVRATVRLHRHVLWAALALVLLAAVLLPAGRWYVQSLAEDLAATGCEVQRTVPGCGVQVRGFLSRSLYFQKTFHFVALAVTALPLLLAAFVAGPLIGRELGSGTYRLQWTQSVSPARWLAARLAVPVAAVLLLLPACAVLAAWIRQATLGTWYPVHWYVFPFYGVIGPVAAASALFGIAVGALAGLVIGRTVPAMAAAVASVGTVGVALTLVRPRLWPALDGPPRGGDVWDFSGPVDRIGARHHPESHFWPLQLVESGILLLLAAVAIVATFALLRRRHP
ncbi:ABC transporter permease [Streptomyces sp. NRRL F-4474]|uniref:ABC transporter permease n=1 Tax=Streptomyces sp. NRRL F-4474 TaxID=1463851 RepID=UPI0004C6E0BE|nr:ABC transporter permease [Streptomyces sp. NRRL F-4474]